VIVEYERFRGPKWLTQNSWERAEEEEEEEEEYLK